MKATINLSFTLTYESGWGWDEVQPYIEETLNEYFLELSETWATQDYNLIVRISQIESRLLNISGIIDIANTKINGLAENFTLGAYNIPTLGTIQAN